MDRRLMPDQQPPIGKRFSHLYIERGPPARDSERFRRRLGAYFEQHLWEQRPEIILALQAELGVEVPAGMSELSVREFFRRACMSDVLDAVTIISDCLATPQNRAHRRDAQWREFVSRAISEENLGYRLDPRGGVHYLVDEKFELNRVAALRCLEAPRFAAVLVEFETAHRVLDEDPPNAKASIQLAFEAAEILTRLMDRSGKISRLGPPEIESVFGPMIPRAYAGDDAGGEAAKSMLEAFGCWVASAQRYRHSERSEEPRSAPMDLAVAILGSAATYIRWLVELERAAARSVMPSA
jgi:hypothetical protein